ncbi:MAG: vitamin K epoxide reductase family protein [Rubricoccaceae bacterium]|nr:vitamin K epoxide reductase family protein [Rubricoccaceae bacterium]
MATNSSRWLIRIIFAVALAGLFLVTEMYLQKTYGRGCFSPEAANELTCDEVFESGAGTFLGVSNVIWGMVFYLVMVGLRFVYVYTQKDQFRKVAFGAAAVGFLYSGYLTYYQYFSDELALVAPCKLCLWSAAIVTILLVLHIMEHNMTRKAPPPKAAFSMKPIVIMAVIAGLAIAGDVAFAKGWFGGEDDVADTPGAAEQAELAANQPQAPQVNIENPAAQCTYDPDVEPFTDAIDNFTDGPYMGSADAPVRIIKFFDPNCPHCKTLHGTLSSLYEPLGDRARFYYVPYPLWQHSFGQVQALYMAQREGKFFEMLDLMFARQQPNGLSLDQVVEIAGDIGMDTAAFRSQLENRSASQVLLAQIMEDRQEAGDVIATADGSVSVPKLSIEGRIVSATYDSYSPDCITYFVDQAIEGE